MIDKMIITPKLRRNLTDVVGQQVITSLYMTMPNEPLANATMSSSKEQETNGVWLNIPTLVSPEVDGCQ